MHSQTDTTKALSPTKKKFTLKNDIVFVEFFFKKR